MKKTTFTRATLATLVTLSLTACGGHSYDGTPSTKPSSVKPTASKDLAEIKKQLADIQNKVKNIKGTDTSGLDKKLAEIKDQIKNIKGADTSGLEKSLAAIQGKVDGLNNTDTAGISKELAAIKDKVKGLKNTDTADITKQLAAISKKVEGLKNTDTTGIAKDLTTIKDKVKDLKNTDTKALQDKLDAITKKIANVDKLKNTSLKDLEEKVAAIKTKLDKLSTKKLEDEIGTDANKKTVQAKLDELKSSIDALADVEQLKKDKEDAEKKAKKLEEADKKEKKYQEELAYKVVDTSTPTTAGTKREMAQGFLTNDKFSFNKVFTSPVKSINNQDVDIKANVADIEIDGKKIKYNRYDLKYSKIASLRLPGVDGWAMDDDHSYDAVYAAKISTFTDEEYKELKANNTGELTYKGRSFLLVKEVNKNKSCQSWPYCEKPDGTKQKTGLMLEEVDMFRDKGAGDAVLTVDLGAGTIKGTLNKFARDGVGDATVTLSEGKIKLDTADGNKLKFSGKSVISQGNTDNDVLSYAKDGAEGTFEGAFAGPHAEELAGRFDIKSNEYKQKGNQKSVTYTEGQYTKYGEIRGVFNAKGPQKESKEYKK